nr:hypothetical protein Iba_scaffold1676729CG0010 [Ipomoea batatas]
MEALAVLLALCIHALMDVMNKRLPDRRIPQSHNSQLLTDLTRENTWRW